MFNAHEACVIRYRPEVRVIRRGGIDCRGVRDATLNDRGSQGDYIRDALQPTESNAPTCPVHALCQPLCLCLAMFRVPDVEFSSTRAVPFSTHLVVALSLWFRRIAKAGGRVRRLRR